MTPSAEARQFTARARLFGAMRATLDDPGPPPPEEKFRMRARIAWWQPLLLMIAVTVHAGPAPLRWRDWDSGLKEARDKKLPVLVDVYTDWCGWCKRMERDVYTQPEVRDYLSRKFVTVK